MQLYTENKKKLQFYYQIWRRFVTTFYIKVYIKVVCKHKTRLVRCSNYFKKQYCMLLEARSFSKKKKLCEQKFQV